MAGGDPAGGDKGEAGVWVGLHMHMRQGVADLAFSCIQCLSPATSSVDTSRSPTSTHNPPRPTTPRTHPQVVENEPIMPAEDFSFFTQAMPSTFLFMGIADEALGTTQNLHSPRFKLDESVLPKGAALFASLAAEYLAAGREGFEAGGGGSSGAAAAREEL